MTTTSRSDSRRRMEHALSKLKPIERQVLMLNSSDGLRLDDIALRLGTTVEALQGHLADALCRLDRLLEPRRRWYWPW